MKRSFETFVLAGAMAAVPFAASAQETQTTPQISSEDSLQGATLDTCLPEGRDTIHTAGFEGQSINGRRILSAVKDYSLAAAEQNGVYAEAATAGLFAAVEHCTADDFDAALLALPTSHLGEPLETLFRGIIVDLKSGNPGNPV